jgi:hypothetical protein
MTTQKLQAHQALGAFFLSSRRTTVHCNAGEQGAHFGERGAIQALQQGLFPDAAHRYRVQERFMPA